MPPFQFEFMFEEWRFGNHKVEIERIKNLDALVDQIPQEWFQDDERLPYWAELWPSAIALSRFIAKHPEYVQAKSVLELGCGLGLTSLITALQKPAYLLLTDYESEALKITARNFNRNRLNMPHLEQIDWREARFRQRFDAIIASDVVYEERFFMPLLNVFREALAPQGRILLAEPNRQIARIFFNLLRDHGYDYEVGNESVEQSSRCISVSIYNIRKRVGSVR